MAADSTRRPPHEPILPGETGPHPEQEAADGDGETLAEKIRRFRQPSDAPRAPAPDDRMIRERDGA